MAPASPQLPHHRHHSRPQDAVDQVNLLIVGILVGLLIWAAPDLRLWLASFGACS